MLGRPNDRPTPTALGRCEVFGNHDAGPRHLAGGRWGPEYNGEIHWYCPNPRETRVRMHCPYGHVGPVMGICRPHFAMVQTRMAGACTQCAMPPEQISLEEQYYSLGQQFYGAREAGDYDAMVRLAERLNVVQENMAELLQRGIVRRVPLKLEEIS